LDYETTSDSNSDYQGYSYMQLKLDRASQRCCKISGVDKKRYRFDVQMTICNKFSNILIHVSVKILCEFYRV